MMKNNLPNAESSIYPGVYVPMLTQEELRKALKSYDKGEMVFPLINVTEAQDSFEMEIAVPGVKREDFLITTDVNQLKIRVLKNGFECPENKQFQMHEFTCENFDRHIILPPNSDAEFILAKYSEGILRLHVPKARNPVRSKEVNIIVY